MPLPPSPPWALTDAALGDLGRLLRRFHDATAGSVQRPDDAPVLGSDVVVRARTAGSALASGPGA